MSGHLESDGGAGNADGPTVAGPAHERPLGDMTPEAWKRIEGILEGALEKPAGERTFFVDQACNGDETLRIEVQSLLAMEGEAGKVVAGAVEGAAEWFEDGLSLAEGEHIGVYRVVR